MCEADYHLMWALKTGDLEEVKDKLLTVEDVNRPLKNNRTPLHYAAEFNQKEMVLFLLSKGAKIDVTDNFGFTPLTCACFEKNVDCVEVLLQKGADKDLKGTSTGVSACEAAAECECEAIQALLK